MTTEQAQGSHMSADTANLIHRLLTRGTQDDRQEAADTIEALRAERDALTEAHNTVCGALAAATSQLTEANARADAEWNKAIEAAAETCTAVIKDYDVMTPCGNKYEPIKVQKAAKGMVSIARQDIRALRRDAGGKE